MGHRRDAVVTETGPDRPGEALFDDGTLSGSLPKGAVLPFLGAAVALALAYGASFMLPDALLAAGLPPGEAGTMIGTGTTATLLGSLMAGRVARRRGLMTPMIGAAAIMGAALACFASVASVGTWIGYLGGLLLGLGWAVAYILMPIQIIQCLRPAARLEALMLLSGSQMAGIGLSAPIGRVLAAHLGSVSRAFALEAALCGLALVSLVAAARAFRGVRQRPLRTVALSLETTRQVLGGKTAFPVSMIGLAACSFSGLSTFQSLLASAHEVPPEAFFLTFTVTTVTLRFSVATRIGRLPLPRLAVALAAAMLSGLFGMAMSGDSLIAYVAATLLFSIGYGLNYSALNALVVDLADRRSIAIPVASQVFTLGYFVGLFGFPVVAARAMSLAGVGSLLGVLIAIGVVNLGVALVLALEGIDSGPRPRA